MLNIRMVDLKGQYDRLKTDIDAAIQDVIDSTAFINGPPVQKFRDELAEFLGVEYVIPCANGTDALQVALMALDLERGDEVITTPFSFIASIEVIKLLGLVPVLVDIDPLSFNLESSLLEAAITEKTRAIIPVHLFGQCANMESILEIAGKHGLRVIEDTAQAVGTDYIFSDGKRQKAGTIGTLGTASFFPSKNLGCYGDGGAIMTRDQKLHDRIKTIVNHGSRVKYYYDEVGVNSRLDTLQAAILSVKLRHLNEFNSARQSAAAEYDKLLGEIPRLKIPARMSWSTHIFHQYTMILDGGKRDKLADYLRSKDIPVMIYYPLPLHLQNAYKDLNYKTGDFPVTESMSESVFSIPMHTELETDQIEYICHHIKKFLTR
ncbi:MAG TPA: DegT/DnrJ/EryC1/StrS family aminotransferase [Bacteroides sp.]|nr:DegT/DnrJ/EryC1/StrS family aminotransferase [Bacteroides sp.]